MAVLLEGVAVTTDRLASAGLYPAEGGSLMQRAYLATLA
jgi:hypothetical protein